MGEPVFVQLPFQGGLDEKTAATYLDPEANQASILNGSFRYVGRVDKRFGIQADKSLAACVVLNPNGIADPYVAPNLFSSALGGLGVQVMQASWAWVEQAQTLAYAGKRPNFTPIRRPLPVRSLAVPLICDGVPALQGTVRAAAWISEPQDRANGSVWTIDTAFLDPSTSAQLLRFPQILINTVDNVTLVNLVYFPNTGVLTLFLVVASGGFTARELRAYTIVPQNNSNVWTLQAGATTALWSADSTCLDVQPMKGDPNDGWIALYLPSTTQTQLTWRYFRNFASFATGTLANTGHPGASTVQIVADWGIDVAFVWNDNPTLPTHDTLHIDYFSADGLFTSLASYSADPSITAALGNFNYTLWEIGGACRVYDKTDATLSSEIYISFWAQDDGLGAGGPNLPVTMGGLVARSGAVSPMGFQYYPYGLRPLVRPAQVLDAQQIVGQYIHISHACVQDYQVGAGVSPTGATLTSLQCTEYLIDFRVRSLVGTPTAVSSSQATIVSTVAPRQLDPYVERWNDARFLATSISADGSRLLVPIAIAGSGVIGTGPDISTIWLSEFTPATTPQAAFINDTQEVSGGMLMRAGPPQLEHGFINFPEFIVVGPTGTGLTGTYSYAVVYARQDRYGNIERSAPAILAAPIVLTNQGVQLQFPRLAWTNDAGANPASNYWIEIYRTLTLGSTYYYLTRVDPAAFAANTYGLYVDNLPDVVLQKAQLLYTTGGVLDNVNPPAARLVCAHRGRLAIVDETLSNVWFTKSETEGEVMGFNEALVQPFIEGGDITAIGSLDDKFVAYKSSSIWVMFGDGPADTGQGSDWTIPQRVPSDVGCVSAASLVAVPQGHIFLSSIGFHLLGRDLQVAYIGKGIQDTTATYSTCIASCVVPKAKQARWCMQDANGNQRVVCFDYFLNQWTVHQYAFLDGPIAQMFLDDAGVVTVLTSTGGRFKESTTSWLDTDMAGASHFVPLSVTSPWIKISGPQGYMMARNVLLYGELQDASGVQMQLSYNYIATPRKTSMWSYSRLESRPTEQVQTHSPAPYAKCESIQVTLTDVDDAAKVTGQGFTFNSIGLDLLKIGDRYRRLPSRLKA